DWHREHRLVGQRDIPLNADGTADARAAADLLADYGIGEIIASPLLRAVQSAEIIAPRFGADVTPDPRLRALPHRRSEGLTHEQLAASADSQRFRATPLTERLPGGEPLGQARDRAIGAVEQALRDAPAGERLAIVSHASIIRLVVGHYLGMSLDTCHRLHVAP